MTQDFLDGKHRSLKSGVRVEDDREANAFNSSRPTIGVLPPITTFTTCGRRNLAMVSISCTDRGASTNVMSAPASMNAFARSIALARPSAARASVRAMICKLESCRQSIAE